MEMLSGLCKSYTSEVSTLRKIRLSLQLGQLAGQLEVPWEPRFSRTLKKDSIVDRNVSLSLNVFISSQCHTYLPLHYPLSFTSSLTEAFLLNKPLPISCLDFFVYVMARYNELRLLV